MSMNTHPIDFEAVVSAALAKQARDLENDRNLALQQQAEQFKHSLAEIQNQMRSLSAAGNLPSGGSLATISDSATVSATQTSNNTMPITPTQSSASKGSKKPKGKSKEATPLRGVRATSEPVATIKKTPTSASKTPKSGRVRQVTPSPLNRKRHPAQLVTSDIPKQYKTTKNSVPAKVDPHLSREFHQRFTSAEQVENAITHADSPQIISQEDILSLRQGRSGRFKLGRGMANIDEMQILYVHAVFSKVGIRVWGPNLEESHDSLFNSACRITALNTFRQLASSGAYHYMNINTLCLNELSFLVNAYNHYVHYVMESRFKKEMKEIGKHGKDEKKKSIQKNRERLCKSRHAYAVANKFPERYIRILNNTLAHSDDEFSPEHNIYIIKTLRYRSNNANIFFRRLDVEMLKADQLSGKQGRKRVRKLPKAPMASTFTKPPIGLPLDFYHCGWIKSLKETDQRLIPDSESVAFLPDAKLSLLPTRVPDEKLGDQAFCAKFRDLLVEPYGLNFLNGNKSDSSDDDSADGDNDDIEVDEDDTDQNEEEAEAEESLFLDEGDYGELYGADESDVENGVDEEGDQEDMDDM
ncbi:hypothetical protein PGTUg99_019153 [Puccinia graminis f. sp. tritici]|uniref:Uncharacterized protein n=1 Tax=Puccinia graminis f. sp. tritici TaxID=56615 RepID=A0A5B0MHA0_PUCGR|nr:hypothetical protein PGTUg99_019153 [Puccinia graminis f. sp. tritici]